MALMLHSTPILEYLLGLPELEIPTDIDESDIRNVALDLWMKHKLTEELKKDEANKRASFPSYEDKTPKEMDSEANADMPAP
jgi:hypothetical protein